MAGTRSRGNQSLPRRVPGVYQPQSQAGYCCQVVKILFPALSEILILNSIHKSLALVPFSVHILYNVKD